MASDEHKNKVAAAVSSAAVDFCETRGSPPPEVAQPKPKTAKPASRVAQPRAAQPKKPAANRSASRR
jgi:hypothetical protein